MPHKLCFETICVENRALKNLEYHEARIHKTRRELWNYIDRWNLAELLVIPDSVDAGLYKCRLAYDEDIEHIKWEPYMPRTIRSIRKVYADHIEYQYKYDNRDELNTLFAQRENADDVLIIKNGMVTDTSYCNVAFFDGTTWFTPESFLLPGTQRSFLLDTQKIVEIRISESDIQGFTQIKLFNAMLGWEQAPVLDVSAIS